MSRKPPTVVVVDSNRRGQSLSRAQAQTIITETAAARDARRKGRTVYRLRRHLAPWWAAVTVMALGATTWLVALLTDHQTAVTTAALTAAAVLFVGWMIARRAGRWRRRILTAAVAAALWLAWTAQTGPTWDAPLALLLATLAIGARWWATIRIPHPKAPTRPEPEHQAGPLEQRWDDNIADSAGALPRSQLTDKDTRQPNVTRFVVHLRPGKQTFTQLVGAMEKISGGLMVPVKRLVIEPHENENPNQARLTIVSKSPIDKTVDYSGARLTGPRRNILQMGPYGDQGYAPWRIWEPGEKPMTGSWLSGFVVGGTGIGKSRLMELLATGYMASRYAIVWFADPQGGASSPALQEHADWYVDSDGVPVMLAALERIAQARELENSVEGYTRFDPTPTRPGIVVFLDECHVTFGKYGKRWADLARKTQKVGISLVGLTQYAALESLGGQEPLRAALLANAVIMRTESRQQGHLIPGVEVDPMTLPAIPGFGYVLRRGAHGRTAPFRAEYLASPEQWMARHPMPVMDALSANAAGDPYQLRHHTAAELQEANRQKVQQMRGGVQDTLPVDDTEDEPELPVFPAPPALHVVPPAPEPQGNGRDRILAVLKQGAASPKMVREATGLGETRVLTLLRELIDAGRVEKVGHGLYQPSDGRN